MNDSKLSMNLISREELKERLDRGDKFKLINALGEWAFEAKRIPGSINISSMRDVKKSLILAMILSYIVLIHHALRV
ncbi:MAG: hypothetical protein WA631_09440 [Nitrososphaeraceae archaeon]